MADVESSLLEIEVKACELASELRSSIQKLDKKIRQTDTIIITALEKKQTNGHKSTVSAFFKVKKDQELVNKQFNQILSHFFCSDDGNSNNNLKILPKWKSNMMSLILLEKWFEQLREEEEVLNQKLSALDSQITQLQELIKQPLSKRSDDDNGEGFKKEENWDQKLSSFDTKLVDLESTEAELEVKACELASELKHFIQTVDKKIAQVNSTIKVSEFVQLKKGQQLLKRKFDVIVTEFFSSDDGNGVSNGNKSLKLLPELKCYRILLILLKRKIEKFKKEEEERDQKLSSLEKCLQIMQVQELFNQPLSERADCDDDDHDRLEAFKKEEENENQKLSAFEEYKWVLDNSNSPNDGSNHGGESNESLKNLEGDLEINQSRELICQSFSESTVVDINNDNDDNHLEGLKKEEEKLDQKLSSLESKLDLDKSNSSNDGSKHGEESKESSKYLGGDLGMPWPQESLNQPMSESKDDDHLKEPGINHTDETTSTVDILNTDQISSLLTALNVIQAKVNDIGNLLCCHLCDVLFVVSENIRLYGKFNYLKSVLELTMKHQGKTNAIRKILFVIEAAEIELERNGKYKLIGSSERADNQGTQDDTNDHNETEIGRIMDMFLKEGQCLESILSDPNLSKAYVILEKEVKTFQTGLEECKKEVEKIGAKVAGLRTIHLFIFENTGEDLVMEQFRRKLKIVIDSQWERRLC